MGPRISQGESYPSGMNSSGFLDGTRGKTHGGRDPSLPNSFLEEDHNEGANSATWALAVRRPLRRGHTKNAGRQAPIPWTNNTALPPQMMGVGEGDPDPPQ